MIEVRRGAVARGLACLPILGDSSSRMVSVVILGGSYFGTDTGSAGLYTTVYLQHVAAVYRRSAVRHKHVGVSG